ncbi:MAG: PEP-CTERM sorting domain-containing protein, partial [Rhodocyclaceae bacterium]|nr:PEP-CTERM sorting domain-containing protein [Rhodocyclaceae bacterium]
PDRDAIGLDNLQVSAVPVPGSAALLALGMLPLCAMRRRLQQA